LSIINVRIMSTEVFATDYTVLGRLVRKKCHVTPAKEYTVRDFEVRHPPLCVTNIIKMKRNRSLNTTNGLLAKMESSYVTTCFGLHLWPSSGYNLVELRVYTICLKVG
jgi:hypothetical protein